MGRQPVAPATGAAAARQHHLRHGHGPLTTVSMAGESPITVTPLEHGFGCRVEGLALGDLDDASFAVLAEAFTTHQVCIISGSSPAPELEVALYRRLETLWDGPQQEVGTATTPATQPEANSAASATNLRGAHPAGLSEISLLGNGVISAHFGLDGFLEPTPWWEKASMQWHVDGSFDGKDVNVCTMMSCYDTPASGLTHSVRWTAGEDGGEHKLPFSGGATCFASTYDAYELCSPEERAWLDTLKVRYWSSPSGFGRVRTGLYPKMSPCGTRVMLPPPKPDGSPRFKQLDSKSSSWSNASAADDEKEDIITLAQRMPAVSGAGQESAAEAGVEPWEGESVEGFLQPLVLVHPATGRRSVFVHTVNMMRLEEAGGSLISWEDSQALICKLFQRVVAPGRAIVHNWKAGEVVFWDNRCCLHSVTPTDLYADEGRLMHRISLRSDYQADDAAVAARL